MNLPVLTEEQISACFAHAKEVKSRQISREEALLYYPHERTDKNKGMYVRYLKGGVRYLHEPSGQFVLLPSYSRSYIRSAINLVITLWKKTPEVINDGACDLFAAQVLTHLHGVQACWLPEGIPHYVIFFDGYYFDAECPYGTKEWRKLPFVVRWLKHAHS